MVIRESGCGYSAAQRKAYMDFWSQRKPESFALEVWLHRFARAVACYDREKPVPITYYENFGRIVFDMVTTAPIHGINRNMVISDSEMQLIREHEELGISLMTVSALSDNLHRVEALFTAGAQKNDWGLIAAGRKLLREPIDGVEAFAPYDKYSWLGECRTAQDVAATLWANFFKTYVKKYKYESSFCMLMNIVTALPIGVSPCFSHDMKFGVVSAPDNLSFAEVVNAAKFCLSKIKEPIPLTNSVADKRMDEFRLKARAFLKKFPLRPILNPKITPA